MPEHNSRILVLVNVDPIYQLYAAKIQCLEHEWQGAIHYDH